MSRIHNIGTVGVTMRNHSAQLQSQLDYPYVPDNIWERGTEFTTTHFTRFAATKAQILTQKALQALTLLLSSSFHTKREER